MDFEQTFPLRFLVNLGRRQDRRETALQQLALHDIAVERLPAVNSRHVRKACGYADAELYALALTNRLGIREARRRGAEAVFFFEDDVVLHPLLREMLATIDLPEEWGIFYLGGQHQSAPQPVGHRLVRCRWTADTHAFAVHRRCYDEVMRTLGNPSATGHGYSDQVLASLQARIPSYAAYPNLAWQAEDASDLAESRYSNYHPATGRQRNHAYALEGLESSVLGTLEDQADAGNSHSPAPGPAQPARLGLCFLTRGSLSHAELWNEWRQPVSDRVRLFVHSKFPGLVSDPGFRESLIAESVPTEWGNISLVRAMLALLRAGLEDPTLTHFCFVSESCVPIRPADDLLEVLTLDPRSRFRSRSSTHMLALGKRDFEPRAEGVRGIPKEMVHFHSQWILLSRHHASLAVKTDLTERFERIFAPDESYFGTLLALHGSGEDTHCSEDVTWVRWKSRRPEEYRMIDDRLAGEWKASGRFFARKVNPVCGPRLRALAQHTQSCLVNKT